MGYQEPRPVRSSLTTTHYGHVVLEESGEEEGSARSPGRRPIGQEARETRTPQPSTRIITCCCLLLQDLGIHNRVLLCFMSTDAKCCIGY